MNINTNDGRSFRKQLHYPKGDPRNPLTDQEVEEKFSTLAEVVLLTGAQKPVREAVWNWKHASSISELMALMGAHARKTKTVTAEGSKHPRAKSPKSRKPALTESGSQRSRVATSLGGQAVFGRAAGVVLCL